MRQTYREQADKFKAALIQKNIKVRQELENCIISNEECEGILENKLADRFKVFYKLESNCACPIIDFGKLELKSFENPKVGQLKGFVAVRVASTLTKLKKKKIST